jgi:hypothetical protein
MADTQTPSTAAVGRTSGSSVLDGKNELSAYLEYNKILRSWFVAFGVGGPALFLINPAVGERLVKSGELSLVSALFLAGTACQVFGALINKITNWYVYRGADDVNYRKKRRYAFSHWLVHQFWLDVALDLATVVTFGIATWHLLTVFGGT